MAQLTSVCVYCGSANGADPAYAAAAEEFGRALAEAGIRLVYGGGSVGLMGIVARRVLVEGGEVTGIIPQFLKDREVMLNEVSELIVTPDMHERKRIMFERSDAFVALPGGIGTLEETVEMLTWAQLGRHAKPVVLANIKGFWDPLSDLLKHMQSQGFLSKAFIGLSGEIPYYTVPTVAEIVPTLQTALAQQPAVKPGVADAAKVM
jgi:uncharacterized protein (TIGR00730 family)